MSVESILAKILLTTKKETLYGFPFLLLMLCVVNYLTALSISCWIVIQSQFTLGKPFFYSFCLCIGVAREGFALEVHMDRTHLFTIFGNCHNRIA